MKPIKTINFEESLIEVIKKEFCCTQDRAEHIIGLAKDMQRDYLHIENQFKTIIKEIFNNGFVFNKMGGFGPLQTDEYYYSIYFRDKDGMRGIVPRKYYKSSVKGLKNSLKSMEDLDKQPCKKCSREVPTIEIEEKKPEMCVYELSYCEFCDRVFVLNIK